MGFNVLAMTVLVNAGLALSAMLPALSAQVGQACPGCTGSSGS